MAEKSPFQYAIVRVVPRIERGECFNAGIVLLCRPRRFLGARTSLDERRLVAIARLADGDASAGPIAGLTIAERFHWLVAPSSTIIQPSEVHTGLSADPRA